jgi:hypothetical protein
MHALSELLIGVEISMKIDPISYVNLQNHKLFINGDHDIFLHDHSHQEQNNY